MLIDQVHHDVGDIKLFNNYKEKTKVPDTPHFSSMFLCWGQKNCSLFTLSEIEVTAQADRFNFSPSMWSWQPKYLRSFLHGVSHIAIWTQMILTLACLRRSNVLFNVLIHVYLYNLLSPQHHLIFFTAFTNTHSYEAPSPLPQLHRLAFEAQWDETVTQAGCVTARRGT